ncbi:membrane protein [Microtetraspora sp. NBRC 13810]|uniref:GtrA family protein n=1 Tax=Microtetraspora sp. NBRC 13810 TaxID=3030990 RepID=UPI0024A0A50C|nr:GtrA family protein [Microtetraspora sp. NBRC 13810]GLW12695.1 membrane protein [Microtetraspora sp. NBRC 13810]
MRFIRHLYQRFVSSLHELVRFGSIGLVAFLLDTGVYNLFAVVLEWGPLTSKVLAASVSTVCAYLGNRLWTFRHREQSGLGREYFLFFLLNGVALLLGVLVIGFTKYTLRVDDAFSLNIANLVGVGLGTLFRFWSYRKWVFLEATEQVPPELPEADVARAQHTFPGGAPPRISYQAWGQKTREFDRRRPRLRAPGR